MYGSFWASTPYSYTNSRLLDFSSANVYPKSGGLKPYGFALRCVARFKIFQKSHSCSTSIEFRRFAQRSKFLFPATFPSRALRSLPLSVMLSGVLNWGGGILSARGTYGSFCASTLYSYINSRRLGFDSTNAGTKGNSNKPFGMALRCVARFTYTFSFQSSPQPPSFGYDDGISRLARWSRFQQRYTRLFLAIHI